MDNQSDTPRTDAAEGKGLNPYFEGRFDGESEELFALRLTLVKEREDAREALLAIKLYAASLADAQVIALKALTATEAK
jgi:hypothetical protein